MNDTPALPDLKSIRIQAAAHVATKWHSISLELETITPVMGGGTTAGEPDLLLPFRPRAIKNSLRHWWWLLNRHKPEYASDSTQLYKDMSEIWGGASEDGSNSHRANVRLKVSHDLDATLIIPYMPFRLSRGRGENDSVELKTEMNEGHFYALWMFKPKNSFFKSPEIQSALKSITSQPADACSKENLKFAAELAGVRGLFTDRHMPVRQMLLAGQKWKLEIAISSETQQLTNDKLLQVRDSIHAWLMLGGVGARTSRGLGRFKLLSIHTKSEDLKQISDIWNSEAEWFKNTFDTKCVKRYEQSEKPREAWENALIIYKKFRQARQKDIHGRRMKQSYGHMANALRKASKKIGHRLPAAFEASDFTFTPLPEAMFGGPINYKFTRSGNEPPEGEILFYRGTAGFERYSSPLLVTCGRVGANSYSAASLYFKDHYQDVKDKSIAIRYTDMKNSDSIAKLKWWPDLTSLEGQNKALELLGEEYRNQALPEQDLLYEAFIDSAYWEDHPTGGDPLAVYLNFFRLFDKAQHQ